MYQDMIEDEVLCDSQSSSSSSRRNSSVSSFMATTTNTRSRRGSITGRQSSIIESNENKQSTKHQIPAKVLVFNGKCSEIFKSTLKECVEDCYVEFPGENKIYIPKSGQKSNINKISSAKSNHRRNSITQFNIPQVIGGSIRSNQINNNLPLSTSGSRIRYPLVQQKFSLVEDITEESTDYQTSIQDLTINDFNPEQQQQSQPQQLSPDDGGISSYPTNFETISRALSPIHRKLPSAPVQSLYRNRQKNFRLSDLVMNGPEYYSHIFNLPRTSQYRTRSISRQRANTAKEHNKIENKYTELDHIKQDLFHRYLWTQKPQVSCRIRPISTYTRSTTFVL